MIQRTGTGGDSNSPRETINLPDRTQRSDSATLALFRYFKCARKNGLA